MAQLNWSSGSRVVPRPSLPAIFLIILSIANDDGYTVNAAAAAAATAHSIRLHHMHPILPTSRDSFLAT